MTWNTDKFNKVAAELAKTFASESCTSSINELATKVAEDNNLNPEQIRTMVRLANVHVFQHVYEKKGSDNENMLEYIPGDAEGVIQSLYEGSKEALDKTASAPAGYDRSLDYYGVEPTPEKEVEKIAEVQEPPKKVDLPSKEELAYVVKRASSDIDIDIQTMSFKWSEAMEKAANIYRLEHGFNLQDGLVDLEKDAVATLGEDIEPELRYIGVMCGQSIKAPLYGGVKAASIVGTHVPIPSEDTKKVLDLFKEARECRYNLQEGTAAKDKLVAQMERVNALK